MIKKKKKKGKKTRPRPRKRSRKKKKAITVKKKRKKTRSRPRSDEGKKAKTFFFSGSVSWSRACFYLFFLLSFFLTSLLSAKKCLRTFNAICVHFLRCANKECEWSYQKENNNISNGLFFINMIYF